MSLEYLTLVLDLYDGQGNPVITGSAAFTPSAVLTDAGVEITAQVRTADRTGVEMEALTSVSAAALTLIDMIKAVDKGAVITDVRLEAKDGGRSGAWRRA